MLNWSRMDLEAPDGGRLRAARPLYQAALLLTFPGGASQSQEFPIRRPDPEISIALRTTTELHMDDI